MIATIAAGAVALVGGGAAGAALTLWVQHRRAERDKTDAKRFLAHTLAFEFERYAIACAETLSDGEPDGPGEEHTPGSMESLPDGLNLPQSTAYQWLDSDLLERVFAFPQDVSVARRGLAYVWQIADGGEYDDEARKKLAEFGLKAAAIGADLRGKNGIAARTLKSGQWTILEYLQANAKPSDPSIPF